MGVKSTVRITRADAVRRATDLELICWRRIVEAKFTALSDKDLEDVLERMNDAANDGEGFENYIICEGQ